MLSEAIWINRLQAALQSKEIPKSTDLHLVATFFRTVLTGMSLQARAGASRETLMKIGNLALQTWPGPAHAKARGLGKTTK
jgi:hypothetical protein